MPIRPKSLSSTIIFGYLDYFTSMCPKSFGRIEITLCQYAQKVFGRIEIIVNIVVADLDSKAQRCRAPGARPAGLRGYSEPRVTRPRPQNDTRSKPFTGYRNRYISQNI